MYFGTFPLDHSAWSCVELPKLFLNRLLKEVNESGK